MDELEDLDVVFEDVTEDMFYGYDDEEFDEDGNLKELNFL